MTDRATGVGRVRIADGTWVVLGRGAGTGGGGTPGGVGKYAGTVGDGASTTLLVAHSLGTADIAVQAYEGAQQVTCEVEVVDANAINLKFQVAPAVGAVRVIVVG